MTQIYIDCRLTCSEPETSKGLCKLLKHIYFKQLTELENGEHLNKHLLRTQSKYVQVSSGVFHCWDRSHMGTKSLYYVALTLWLGPNSMIVVTVRLAVFSLNTLLTKPTITMCI